MRRPLAGSNLAQIIGFSYRRAARPRAIRLPRRPAARAERPGRNATGSGFLQELSEFCEGLAVAAVCVCQNDLFYRGCSRSTRVVWPRLPGPDTTRLRPPPIISDSRSTPVTLARVDARDPSIRCRDGWPAWALALLVDTRSKVPRHRVPIRTSPTKRSRSGKEAIS